MLKGRSIDKILKDWESIFNSISHSVIILDRNHRIIKANQVTLQLAGLTKEEITKKKCHDIFHHSKIPPLSCPIRTILDTENNKPVEMELEALGKTFLVSCTPVCDDKGNVDKIIHIATDISDRKKMENALRQSEMKYRKILDTMTDGVAITNELGHFLDVNRAFCSIYGYSSEELLRMKATDLIHSSNRNKFNEFIQSILTKGFFQGETLDVRKDGSQFYTEIQGSKLELNHKKRFLAVIRDISQQKEIEMRLHRVQKMEAIGTLAGGIAHDFNNILSALIGYTELVIEDIPKGTLTHENLTQVFASAMRARDLVKQILTFSRHDKNEINPVHPVPLVKESIGMLRSMLPSTIEIQPRIDGDISHVMTNPSHIQQIIINLGTNAAHAMEEFGGTLTIELTEVEISDAFSKKSPDLKKGPYVKLSVRDTGIGIEDSLLQNIFDPYFTTKEKSKGTGLGLSVVHGIVKGSNGEILVKSKKGKGTIFSVYFPSMEHPVIQELKAIDSLPKGNESILVVDDEPALVKMCEQRLTRLGYRVTTFTNSKEALEDFQSRPEYYDMIITDMTMPHITGDVLTRRILELKPTIPIILCTGYSENITEKKAHDIGIKAFLMKPIVWMDLAHTVRKILD